MRKSGIKTITTLWASFLLVLIIPIVAFFISHTQTQRIVTEKTEDYTYALLEQLRETVDAKWEKYITISYRINQNAKIKAMAYTYLPLANTDYYSIWEIGKELRNYAISDDYIVELGVYFPRSDRLINTYSQWDLERLYQEFFYGSEAIADFDHFKAMLEGVTSEGVFFPPVTISDSVSQRKYTLPYVFKLPLDSTSYTEGYIFFFLDINKFSSLLSRVDVFQQGNVYVIGDGRVLFQIGDLSSSLPLESIPDTPKGFVRKDGFVVAHVASQLQDWVYLIEVPDSIIVDESEYLRTSAMLLVTTALLVGAVVAAYLAVRTTRPVQRLLQMLTDGGFQSTSGNDFQHLEGSVTQLLSSNTRMEEVLERYGPMLQMEFLGNLMRGEYMDDAEIQRAMDSMGFRLEGDIFLVLLVHMESGSKDILQHRLHLERRSDARILLSGIISEEADESRIHVCLAEKNKVAVLISGAKDEVEYLPALARDLALSVQTHMANELGINVAFFGSAICNRLVDISSAFSEARSALEYFSDADFRRDIYWSSLIPEQSMTYYYPFDVQLRLFNLASSGKEQEVLSQLDELYTINFQQKQLPHSERVQLLVEMRGTLLKLYHKYKLDHSELNVFIDDCNKGTEEVFRALRQYFKLLCRYTNRQYAEKNSSVLGKINAYIEQNYANPALSLTMVGEYISMDEVALSAFYKKRTGLSLVTEIERLRMDEACRLLSEGHVPIAEIALAVGYNNDKSFRRAFKRSCGMSPTEYRSNNPTEQKDTK